MILFLKSSLSFINMIHFNSGNQRFLVSSSQSIKTTSPSIVMELMSLISGARKLKEKLWAMKLRKPIIWYIHWNQRIILKLKQITSFISVAPKISIYQLSSNIQRIINLQGKKLLLNRFSRLNFMKSRSVNFYYSTACTIANRKRRYYS